MTQQTVCARCLRIREYNTWTDEHLKNSDFWWKPPLKVTWAMDECPQCSKEKRE